MAKKLLRKTKRRQGTKRLSRVKKGGTLTLQGVIQKPNKVGGPNGRDASTLRGSKELFQQWADRQFSSDPENQQMALYSLQVENSGSRFTFYYKSVRNEWYKVILQANKSIEEMMAGMSLNENTFNVKTLSGDVHQVYYDKDRKIRDVVDELATKLGGVLPKDIMLVASGKPAHQSPNSTLADFNINKGSTIHVLLRLKGGPGGGKRRKKRTRKKRRKSKGRKRRRKKRTKRRRRR